MSRAIEVLNKNNEQLNTRLYGRGRWKGKIIQDDGAVESSDGTFRLHVAWPERLCFQTRGLGGNYFEAGCNDEACWFWLQYEQDHMTIGSREAMADILIRDIPVRPHELINALGVQFVHPGSTAHTTPIYRVTEDHHQLIYEESLEGGQSVITREYWLSRYQPFLIDRVILRLADGRISMDARLSNFAALENLGPLVARKIEITWPLHSCELMLDFKSLSLFPDVQGNIWFADPSERPLIDQRHHMPETIRRLKIHSVDTPSSATLQSSP